VSVRVVTHMAGPDRLPPWYETNEFGSLGTLRMLFVLETQPGVTECGP